MVQQKLTQHFKSTGGSVSEVCLQCGRPGFDPWVRKIPSRRKWQPTPVSLPRDSMDRGAWWATVHGVVKSLTRLSAHAHSTYPVLVAAGGSFYLPCSRWDLWLIGCDNQTLSCDILGSSSLTRDQTQAPYIESMESWPLNHQGSLCC